MNGNKPVSNTPCGIGNERDAFGGCYPIGDGGGG